MLISKIEVSDLWDALEKVNKVFDGNVTFNRCDPESKTRYQVTLKVLDSRGKGAKLGHSGRRTRSACWHVHGVFIDSLPDQAKTWSAPFKRWIKPGDKWNDKNIGSLVQPLRYSESCECEKSIDFSMIVYPKQGVEYHYDKWGN